jgi:hypothetical protein
MSLNTECNKYRIFIFNHRRYIVFAAVRVAPVIAPAGQSTATITGHSGA